MMTTSTDAEPVERALIDLARIEAAVPRTEMRPPEQEKPRLMGRIFGRASADDDGTRHRFLTIKDGTETDARVAALVAYTLLHADHRGVIQVLPEALVEGPLPKDDEERFVRLGEAARLIVRHHLAQTVLNLPEAELEAFRLRALVDALEDESVQTLAERLKSHLHANIVQRGRDLKIVDEDALLIEIDNVVLEDVDADGTMAHSMVVLVDGHPLAVISSPGDGTIAVQEWLGGHGPDDLEALRHYVAQCGEPRHDELGERPDSLEEVLLDRVTSLLTRYAYIQALSDAVLFCDVDEEAPGGHVIRVAPIDPELARADVWEIVTEEFPNSLLLDLLNEEDGFTLWLAYSTV